MTKVKITSDGTHPGTKVTVNGERINDVVDIRWSVRPGGFAEVTIKLNNVELDVDGQVAMKYEGFAKPDPLTDEEIKAMRAEFEADLTGTPVSK